MRYAPVLMILVLSGCSEWNLRSLIGSNALGPDTGHTGLDDPLSRGDTAPPDDMRPGAGLPTHCNPPDDPTMTPVWNPGEAPPMHSLSGNFDFDSQGRALWVRSGTLSWVDRSGTSGRMDTEWNYPYDATIRVLPNGGVVVSGEGRLDVRDPDAGVTLRSIHENLGPCSTAEQIEQHASLAFERAKRQRRRGGPADAWRSTLSGRRCGGWAPSTSGVHQVRTRSAPHERGPGFAPTASSTRLASGVHSSRCQYRVRPCWI